MTFIMCWMMSPFTLAPFFRDDTFVGVIELSIHLKRACYGFRIHDFLSPL